MLKREISYKTSVIVFAALLLLAATVVNLSLNAGQSRINSNNSKATSSEDKENNHESDTDTDEDNSSTENTSDSTQPDQQTNSDDTSTTNPPTSQPPTSPPPISSGQTITVTINSSGSYSQLNLTINKGDTIKWVNNDNKKHWPASDPHPQHTNYSGFDSGGINQGGSWSFTFNNKGSWGWHDHQFPSTTGIITVL